MQIFRVKKPLCKILKTKNCVPFEVQYTNRCVSLDIRGLPGEALRTLVESRGLPSDSTRILKDEPGKLDIKTRIWYFIYQLTSWFTFQTNDYDVIIAIRVDSTPLATSFKKCNVMMTW